MNEQTALITNGNTAAMTFALMTRAIKGGLRGAIEAGVFTTDQAFPELGDIVSGKAAGRSADTDITIADLTGTGVQDTVIATLARQRADAAGAGATFQS